MLKIFKTLISLVSLMRTQTQWQWLMPFIHRLTRLSDLPREVICSMSWLWAASITDKRELTSTCVTLVRNKCQFKETSQIWQALRLLSQLPAIKRTFRTWKSTWLCWLGMSWISIITMFSKQKRRKFLLRSRLILSTLIRLLSPLTRNSSPTSRLPSMAQTTSKLWTAITNRWLQLTIYWWIPTWTWLTWPFILIRPTSTEFSG